jgi:hypothetical protein
MFFKMQINISLLVLIKVLVLPMVFKNVHEINLSIKDIEGEVLLISLNVV